MSPGFPVVAVLNERWRIVLAHDQGAWRRPAWLLQHMVDDAWHDHAYVRASGMLRDLVKAYAGPVDADAAAILDALPARVDVRLRGSSTIDAAPR